MTAAELLLALLLGAAIALWAQILWPFAAAALAALAALTWDTPIERLWVATKTAVFRRG